MPIFIWFLLTFILAGFIQGEDPKDKKLQVHFSERFRFVGYDNSIFLDEANPLTYNFTRNRSSLSLLWTLNKNIEIFAKLTNEFRYYLSPKDMEFDISEVFFDNLYVKITKPGNLPFTLTVGRQNIMLGEGFIVMDGHPLDGSRSIYFNAARTDFFINDKHKITAFYTYVPVTDNLLPIINSIDQYLIEQPESGLGLYYTGKFKPLRLEAYLIHKQVRDTEDIPFKSNIEIMGLRTLVSLSKGLSFTLEGACQTGKFEEFSRSAPGGYMHLDYKIPSIGRIDNIRVGGIYLGGDDPSTEKIEGWDPVFSRWPKCSESFIYTLIIENNGKVAYWSNLNALYTTIIFKLSTNVNFHLSYYHLGANQKTINNPFTAGTGKNRGDLYIMKLNFKINKHLSGHILWEDFIPGNFYFDGADTSNWIRFELIYKI